MCQMTNPGWCAREEVSEVTNAPIEAPWPSSLKEETAAMPPPATGHFVEVPENAACISALAEAAYFPQKRLGSSEEGAAMLLPKMKRRRLRPSIGQLRLQREASDVESLPPWLKLSVQPEQLRASLGIDVAGCFAVGVSGIVLLELSFPPQYPHRPPKISQVSPQGCLPFWRYEDRFLILERLSERGWSSVMGVSDILKDVLQPIHQARSCGTSSFHGGFLQATSLPVSMVEDLDML
eukprot:TRINITY_DN62651_c0_g1_i1.p1 TRINITY_DN62651_c0_g1~~TRINITY_DN62651_c0_g1_i1.p1  ORF type:complete len:237 (+),score=43.84 TRINITY_DN62651_c0_g1_i1:83-793(+)